MTNEEAIKLLDDITSYCDFTDEYGDMIDSTPYYEALDLAIKALEQQSCEDCISREQAIKQCGFGMTSLLIADALQKLPSVTPQPKIGKWRHYEGMLICSECGAEFYDDIMEYCGDNVPKCCPDCGAKMEDEE